MNWKSYHFTRTEPGGPWFYCDQINIPIPFKLKVERPFRSDISNRCSYVMHSGKVAGKYTSFTGLQATQWQNIFTGDLLLPVGKSFVVVELNAEKLTLHVVENFKVFPRARAKVAEVIVNQKHPSAI